jgi:dolichol-phosphate mannosyltransferase
MLLAAILTSLALLAVRLDLAHVLGLSDAEALFVAYGLHPQPAYLDNPGLIGWLAHDLGSSATPALIHCFSAVAATLLPWVGVVAARALGAPPHAALRSYFPLALLPELSLGASAFTPNLPLAFCWLAALGSLGWALRKPPASFGTLLGCLAVGAAAGLCCLAKTSGWVLALALAWACLQRAEGARFRTLGPWAGAAIFGILVLPLIAWWRVHGVSLRGSSDVTWLHGLSTSLRPLLSATPPFLVAGALLARDLWKRERTSPVDRLLRIALVVPLLPLWLLALYANSEAEWLTPAYLVLSLQAARAKGPGRSLDRSCVAFGAGVVLLAWCWLRTDLPFRVGQMAGGYDGAWDISSDLYGWGPGRGLLERAVADARQRTGQTPLVIGPHWAICAQADVALGGRVPVGCDSAQLDDYDYWSRAANWPEAETILFVTDSRFNEVPPDSFYGRPSLAVHDVVVTRAGREVRRISVSEFDRDEANAQGDGAAVSPARASSARSSEASGFGVVSSLSP